MKRALIIASVASMIEQFNMNNIKLLQELGYNVDVATNFENSGNISNEKSEQLKNELREMNVNCFQINFDRGILSKSNIEAYKQIKKILKENTYDLVHMHSPIGGVCGRIAARKYRKKGTRTIYTAHGFHFYKGAPILNWITFYPIEKYLSRYTDCLITINQEDYQLARKRFKAKKVELIHGVGVDENKFNFKMTDDEKYRLKRSIGLKDDDFVLIQIGELNKNKNQIMSINAMKDLVEQNSKIHLLLVGKGPLDKYYENIIKEKNLGTNVHLLGYRKDVPQLLKISNCAISTSIREGLGLNIVEAMVVNKPSIVTNNRGHRELIQDSVNGFFVNNEKELKEKINYVIKDRNFRQNVNNNRKGKIELFLSRNINKKMQEIYS